MAIVRVSPNRDGLWTAELRGLPWCLGEGVTPGDALRDAVARARMYVREQDRRGESIPGRELSSVREAERLLSAQPPVQASLRSSETSLRIPLSSRISSLAASISSRLKTRVSDSALANSKTT